jgi:hypothetical protein
MIYDYVVLPLQMALENMEMEKAEAFWNPLADHVNLRDAIS